MSLKKRSRKAGTEQALQKVAKRASEKLGEALRAGRIEKGLSQGDLAKILGYKSPQYISDWERAYSPIPMQRLVEISRILGLDRDRLFELFLEFSVDQLSWELRSDYNSILKKKA